VAAVGELDARRVAETRAASGGDHQQVVVIVDVIVDVIIVGDEVTMTSHTASVVLSLAAETDASAAAR